MSYFYIIFTLIVGAQTVIDFQCLKCICETMTDCKSNPCDPVNCRIISVNNLDCSCGPFGITPPFWLAANKPLLDNKNGTEAEKFKRCAETFPCSIWAVQYYLDRYALDCDGDQIVDCDDYVLLHIYGPLKCLTAALDDKKLERYKMCMARKEVIINSNHPGRAPKPEDISKARRNYRLDDENESKDEEKGEPNGDRFDESKRDEPKESNNDRSMKNVDVALKGNDRESQNIEEPKVDGDDERKRHGDGSEDHHEESKGDLHDEPKAYKDDKAKDYNKESIDNIKPINQSETKKAERESNSSEPAGERK